MEEDGRPASAPPPECSEVDQGDEGVQGEGDQQAPIKLRRKKVAGRAGAKMLRAMKTQSLDNVILPTQLQEVEEAEAERIAAFMRGERVMMGDDDGESSFLTKVQQMKLRQQNQKVFGWPLTHVMVHQHRAAQAQAEMRRRMGDDGGTTKPRASSVHSWIWESYADNTANVPAVVYQVVEHIREHGMETEGIFRLVGKHSDVDQIRRNIDAHMQVNLSNVTMHSVAEVLKLYLRELPYPIIPRSQFFDRFKAASTAENADQKKAYLAALVAGLPQYNRALLRYLCKFLHEVSEHSSSNKMAVPNLAMVFSLAFLGEPDSPDETNDAVECLSQSLQRLEAMEGNPQFVAKKPSGTLSPLELVKDAQLCTTMLGDLIMYSDDIQSTTTRPPEIFQVPEHTKDLMRSLKSVDFRIRTGFKPQSLVFVFQRLVRLGICHAEVDGKVVELPRSCLSHMQNIGILLATNKLPVNETPSDAGTAESNEQMPSSKPPIKCVRVVVVLPHGDKTIALPVQETTTVADVITLLQQKLCRHKFGVVDDQKIKDIQKDLQGHRIQNSNDRSEYSNDMKVQAIGHEQLLYIAPDVLGAPQSAEEGMGDSGEFQVKRGPRPLGSSRSAGSLKGLKSRDSLSLVRRKKLTKEGAASQSLGALSLMEEDSNEIARDLR